MVVERRSIDVELTSLHIPPSTIPLSAPVPPRKSTLEKVPDDNLPPANTGSISAITATSTHKMVVKIRLARFGRKRAPVYNIVVAQARSARDSRPLEVLGTSPTRINQLAEGYTRRRGERSSELPASRADRLQQLLTRFRYIRSNPQERHRWPNG